MLPLVLLRDSKTRLAVPTGGATGAGVAGAGVGVGAAVGAGVDVGVDGAGPTALRDAISLADRA